MKSDAAKRPTQNNLQKTDNQQNKSILFYAMQRIDKSPAAGLQRSDK